MTTSNRSIIGFHLSNLKYSTSTQPITAQKVQGPSVPCSTMSTQSMYAHSSADYLTRIRDDIRRAQAEVERLERLNESPSKIEDARYKLRQHRIEETSFRNHDRREKERLELLARQKQSQQSKAQATPERPSSARQSSSASQGQGRDLIFPSRDTVIQHDRLRGGDGYRRDRQPPGGKLSRANDSEWWF